MSEMGAVLTIMLTIIMLGLTVGLVWQCTRLRASLRQLRTTLQEPAANLRQVREDVTYAQTVLRALTELLQSHDYPPCAACGGRRWSIWVDPTHPRTCAECGAESPHAGAAGES